MTNPAGYQLCENYAVRRAVAWRLAPTTGQTQAAFCFLNGEPARKFVTAGGRQSGVASAACGDLGVGREKH
jgi:hypothetical protein